MHDDRVLTVGCRVRLVFEWYDPDATEDQSAAALEQIVDRIEPLLPSDAWSQLYIESAPPDIRLSTRR